MSQNEFEMTCEQQQVKNFEALVVRIISNLHAFNYLCDEEERTGILSKTAPSFFNTLYSLLHRDFILESAKILESSESFGRKNLTVSLFVERKGWTEEQQIKLNDFSNRLKSFYPKIKDARNKIIGHNDLLTYENDDILGVFDAGLEDEFVGTLEDFYNYLHEITFGGIWGKFLPNVEQGSVYELITHLYHGLAFEAVANDSDTPNDEKMRLVMKSLEIKKMI